MKKLITTLILGITFYACKTTHDIVRPLELGMQKQIVISEIGNNYAIESISDTPDGRLETLRYPADFYPAYLLVFLNGKLVEINRDHKPIIPQQNLNITEEKKD